MGEPELVIPAGWKRATLSTPVPVVRCHYIFPDTHDRPGEQCKRWSIRGHTKCIKHGGQLSNVQEYAAATVESARMRLVGLTDKAVDTLEELMDSATSEAVRLGAVKEIMDRGGVHGKTEVEVAVTDGRQSPADVLRDRLKKLRERTIDGEVVSDTAVTEDTVDTVDTPSAVEGTPPEENA